MQITKYFQQLGVNPKIRKINNEIWIRIWNKFLWTDFLEFFSPGNKKLKKIPKDWKGFLRGFFDTDGSIHLDKKKYPVISIRNNNEKILMEMKRKLEFIQINAYVYGPEITEFGGKVYKLRINGSKNCIKWMTEIGSSNPRKNDLLMSCVKAIQ